MSGISTKGIKSDFIPKELKPGNVVAKINNLTIEQVKNPKDVNNPEYKIWIELEGKPIGDGFIGFDKVFGDPSLGQSLGQTKKIQFSNWPIKDNRGTAKATGKQYEILASTTILKFLQKLLTEAGAPKWLNDNDGKFDTFQQMFIAIMRTGLLKDKFFSWCIAATESQNAKGYSVYYMYLPDYKQAADPFAIEGGLVTKFDPAIHIKKDERSVGENDALNNGADEEDDNEFTSMTGEIDPFDIKDEELFDLED